MTFSIRSVLLTLLLSLALAGCGTTKKKAAGGGDVDMGSDGGSDASEVELNADSDSGKAGGLRTVFFAYDSATLNSSTRSQLQKNVNFLKANGSVEVQVEGHCDERGGVQYNLALGERRAKAVKDYMVAMGVSSSRVSTISFGKERPVSFGHDESAWSQNRRANFVVTAK
ncbi:MAG: peptidoglycan-associated lipoprotein Pal [Bacteriovoracaceae bacterium]|nr:peptidoglycan-associated lipoprotein Pal [Bacteriovoracaceae bacterium]